jgi:hypothetical protein
MEINQAVALKKVNRAFKASLYFHCAGLVIVAFLCYLQPVGYKTIGVIFSILAFVISILISRSYFYAEKELKQGKAASNKSLMRKYSEQLLLFFFPYTFWCGCIGIFFAI